jgi:hypothetical protein
MVNYHEPAVVAQGYSAYMAKHVILWPRLGVNRLSTAAEARIWHVVAGLYLFVCPAAARRAPLLS